MAAVDANRKTFILHSPTTDLEKYRAIAEAVRPLAEHGRVLVNISEVADKAWHVMPGGISPWHEYANCNPTLFNFFPHPLIAPHLPAPWVKTNRDLLLAKAAILEELGFGAFFWSYEPNMLPESFFREHPRLRGGRIDHPRRGNGEEFALCVDLPETQDILAAMMSDLKQAVPHLEAFSFKTNDAGAGLCWAGALYPGPNGPQHCRDREPGQRVADMVAAFHRGAEAGGGAIDVYIGHANFWNNESYSIAAHLPSRTHFAARQNFSIGAGSLMGRLCPIRGLIDPLALLETMEGYDRPAVHTVFLDFRASYDRGFEEADTVARAVTLIDECIRKPVKGLIPRLERLRAWAAHWGGEEQAERLLKAFYDMHDAFRLRGLIAPVFSTMYLGVSNRYMVRPLVIRPDLLIPEEENYFLPHVFNTRLDEARNDYIDLHGGRFETDPDIRNRIRPVLNAAGAAADAFAAMTGTPEGAWLGHLARALKIWASIMRSCANFYAAQLIRDRNAAVLQGADLVPEKKGSMTGHPDTLPWNEIMRDEFDNACELADVLADGGLDAVMRAPDAKHEDTFLLGPDLLDQVRKKTAVMRAHWRDVERWLAPPHK